MFDSLTDSLGHVFRGLQGRGLLKEQDINTALTGIRGALLEADVALPVVRNIETIVRDKAMGQKILTSITPEQQIVKIVNDCILELLGGQQASLALDSKPSVYLMVGVQGSGKTTTCAKLAAWLQRQHQRTVMLAGIDTTRAAAGEQLQQLADRIGVACHLPENDQSPRDAARAALQACADQSCDVLIIDSAGRTQVDDALMAEIKDIVEITQPHEILLVADAMIGQDAIRTAKGFNDALPVSGLIFTRIDGDARGGAVLSARHTIQTDIKFLGVGEKIEDFEVFHPDRIASRIVGQGDVISLVEKVQLQQTDDEIQSANRVAEGSFDLNDMLKQLGQIRKMGGISDMLRFLPASLQKAMPKASTQIDDKALRRQEAVILSMTKRERTNPKIIHANRRKRIARGSGVHVRDVNRLLKQFQSMQAMMKIARKRGGLIPGMSGNAEGLAEMGTDGLLSKLPSSR